jgi:hypothetical protein
MSGMQRWTLCVECKEPVKHPGVYGDCCSRECCGIRDAYERGREEERADVVATLRKWAESSTRSKWLLNDIANELAKGEHEVKR